MEWALIARLIAEVGVPTAFKIWQLAQQNSEPTEADWQVLLNLSNKTAADYKAEAAAKANKTV